MSCLLYNHYPGFELLSVFWDGDLYILTLASHIYTQLPRHENPLFTQSWKILFYQSKYVSDFNEFAFPDSAYKENQPQSILYNIVKGELKDTFAKEITIAVENDTVVVTRPNDLKLVKSLHGTTNALIKNMIVGVSEGYKKELEIVGVGYRFQVAGNKINVNAGFSHPVVIDVPDYLKVEQVNATEISISGIDKQKVSEFAANIRKLRKPEPYKGKGIRYKGEHIRRKEGKKAAK